MTTKSFIITATFDEAKTRFTADEDAILQKLAAYAGVVLSAATDGQVPHCEAQEIKSPHALATLAALEFAAALPPGECRCCGGVATHAAWCPDVQTVTVAGGGYHARN